MDIKAYIESGILEAYVLGELSADEARSVESLVNANPQLQDEKNRIEESLENLGTVGSIQPPAELREKILARMEIHKSTDSEPASRKMTGIWQWAAAACFLLAVAAGYLAMDFRSKYLASEEERIALIQDNERIASDYNQVNDQLDNLESEVEIISNTRYARIFLEGTEAYPDNEAAVFWDSESKKTYLKIKNLKKIASDSQYQLWAIIDGKPVNAGVFSGTGFFALEDIREADAFAITVEPQGGSENPTLESMLVLGTVPGKS